MQAASRKKETKEQRLARKGADQDHFKTLVRKLSHATLLPHAFTSRRELQTAFYLHEADRGVVKDDIRVYLEMSHATPHDPKTSVMEGFMFVHEVLQDRYRQGGR